MARGLRAWGLGALTVVASSTVAGAVAAQGNPRSERLGGAGALLGDTGVALASQATAPLSNPARTTRVPAGSLFLNRFIHGRFSLSSDFLDPTGQNGVRSLAPGDVGTSNFDLDLLNGGVCFVADPFGTAPEPGDVDRWGTRGHAGHHQFAACVTVTELEELGALANGGDGPFSDVSGTVYEEWVRRQIGLGWGWDITDRVSVGLSGMLAITRYREAVQGSALAITPAGVAVGLHQQDASGVSFDLVPKLGLTYSPSDHVTLGLSGQLPSIHVDGSWARTLVRAESEGGFVRSAERGEFITALPPRIDLGVGVHDDTLRVELDAFVHLPQPNLIEAVVDHSSFGVVGAVPAPFAVPPPSRRREAADPVTNVAIGLEWLAFDGVGLLTGFSTDRSVLRPLGREPEGRLAFRRLDRIHATGGFSFYGPVGRLLFGARLTYGWGELRVPDPLAPTPGTAVAQHEELGFLAHVGGRIELTQIGGAFFDGGVLGILGLDDEGEDEDEPAPE